MLNQVVLVGRIKELYDDNLVLAIPNQFKNEQGEYDTNIIPVKLSNNIAEHTKEYCEVGGIVGIKGRLVLEGTNLTVAVEKVSYLSSRTQEGGETNGEQ